MAQHITTIQEIRDRMVAQEQQISDDDILTFDHGTPPTFRQQSSELF